MLSREQILAKIAQKQAALKTGLLDKISNAIVDNDWEVHEQIAIGVPEGLSRNSLRAVEKECLNHGWVVRRVEDNLVLSLR